MLNKLHVHEAHMGIVKTQTRAREILFWPKMNQDIEYLFEQCAVCNKYWNSNYKAPLKPQEIRSRPWAKFTADMFRFKGSEYLLCRLLFQISGNSPYAYDIQSTSQQVFARLGIPSKLLTDNWPQCTSYAFKKFATEWDFVYTISGPIYPQADRSVQTVSNLL